MQIDYPTLLLVDAAAMAIFGALCLLLARSEASLAPLRILGYGNLVLALSLPIFLLRGGHLDAVGIALGNALVFVGTDLQRIGARTMLGRPGRRWIGPAIALGWILACEVPAFMDSYAARVTVASLLTAGLAAPIARDVVRGWTGWRPLRFGIALVCGLYPLALAARLVVLGLHGAPGSLHYTPVLIFAGFVNVAACTLFLSAEAMRRAGIATRAEIATAHAEAAASRDLLSQVIENLPVVIYVNRIRPDFRWTRLFLSANTERAIGWPRAALDADDSLEIRTEWTEAEKRAALVELTTQGQVVVEVSMRRPDGSRFWARRQSRIARRHADGSVDVVGYVVDITQERALTAQVQASVKLATLGEMMTGLAHELGQPAATMCLAAGNAARGLRNRGEAAIPDALKRLDRIIGQGERMGALLQHLKAFARSEPLALGPIAVAAAVDGALALTAAGLREEEIRLELDLPADLPLVHGQMVPLEQVLVNLLLNARDAIRPRPPGTPRWIRLAAGPDGAGQVVLTVADSGGGIDPTTLPRLFEPFFTTKPVGEGLGLGLSVSHGLVRGMGGVIGVANGAHGAVFTVTLPCALVEATV